MKELESLEWEVDDILKRRDFIIRKVEAYLDKVMDTELADGAATEIEAALKWHGTKYPIRNTLVLHTGIIFGKSQWRQLAWQIAANESRLRMGIPLSAFSPTAVAQWIVVEIIGVGPAELNDGRKAVELEFRALTGVNAGFSFKERLTDLALCVISRDVGYNKLNKYDENPLMFIGMRMAVKLVDGRIERFYCDDGTKTENRRMIRLRRRDRVMPEIDENFNNDGSIRTRWPLQYGCPRKYDHNCWECPLTTADCLAAYK